MTKEITKARIIQEIQDKLNLRELEPERFAFRETVVPIYDIAPHLQFHTADQKTLSITSIGGKSFFLVPDDERWILSGYTVTFVGAGAFTVSGVYIVRKKQQTSASYVYLDLTAGISVSYTMNLPKPLTLVPGDFIGVNIDSYTSTQNLIVFIDYIMEKIR